MLGRVIPSSRPKRGIMSATNVVLGAIVAFIFTGVIANWLVQRWQYRNWLNQQRFLGAEKRYELLKSLADEISLNASKRLSSMFRLVASLALSQEGSKRED